MKSNRFHALDGLRGLAAVLIVLAHIRIDELFWATTLMDMFFVMSAFMIGRLVFLKARNYAGLIAFYRRRMERLWPLYFFTIAVIFIGDAILALISDASSPSYGSLWRYLTFSQYSELIFASGFNYDYPHAALHTWSLAVEEQFYIALPLLFVGCLVLRERLIVPVLLATGVAGVMLRLAGSNYYVLTFHIDSFCWGALLAYFYPWMMENKRAAGRIFIAMVAVGIFGYTGYLQEGFALYFESSKDFPPAPHVLSASWLHMIILFWVGIIGLMVIYPQARLWAIFRRPLPVLLGLMSYSLYLIHVPIIVASQKLLIGLLDLEETELMLLVTRSVSIPAIFLAAYLMFRLIDRPLQQRGTGFIRNSVADADKAN